MCSNDQPLRKCYIDPLYLCECAIAPLPLACIVLASTSLAVIDLLYSVSRIDSHFTKVLYQIDFS